MHNTQAKEKEIIDRWRAMPTAQTGRHLSNQVEPEVVVCEGTDPDDSFCVTLVLDDASVFGPDGLRLAEPLAHVLTRRVTARLRRMLTANRALKRILVPDLVHTERLDAEILTARCGLTLDL